MNEKEEAPSLNNESLEHKSDTTDKIIKNLPKHQRAVYDLLRRAHLSAADISRLLGYSDPRGHIRCLRKKGINVVDEWRTGKPGDGVRYKVYFIPGKQADLLTK